MEKLNDTLEEKTEEIKFDTSTKALNSKLYEIHLTEDPRTGEPDQDIPSFDKNLSVVDLNQSMCTLVIRSRK